MKNLETLSELAQTIHKISSNLSIYSTDFPYKVDSIVKFVKFSLKICRFSFKFDNKRL